MPARAAIGGSVAAALSTLALISAAKAEGKAALQPLNATSHWLNGDAAANVETVDARHTAVGYATHHAATIFWAALFELRPGRTRETPFRLARNAVAMAAIAAGVDYLATPERFTPGWELVLTKRSMAWSYLALAAGFGMGALIGGRASADLQRKQA